jgi:hypothetical protein
MRCQIISPTWVGSGYDLVPRHAVMRLRRVGGLLGPGEPEVS